MLKQRLITALILLLGVSAGIVYLSKIPFALIAGAIALGSLWEWANLANRDRSLIVTVGFLVMNAVLMYSIYFIPSIWIGTISLILWLILSFWVVVYPRGSGCWQHYVILRWLTGTLVIVPAWSALIHIRFHQAGLQLLLLLFLIIWTVDSAAYFVGRYAGRRLLVPMISPKKTIEGLLGGLFASSLVSIAYTYFVVSPPYKAFLFAAIVLTTMIMAVMGDLFESVVKRQAKVKDSSQLLPGHGGLLDRLDSLFAAAPIFAFGISLLDFI